MILIICTIIAVIAQILVVYLLARRVEQTARRTEEMYKDFTKAVDGVKEVVNVNSIVNDMVLGRLEDTEILMLSVYSNQLGHILEEFQKEEEYEQCQQVQEARMDTIIRLQKLITAKNRRARQSGRQVHD